MAASHMGGEMRIAGHCQDRALLLLHVAQECPDLKEQAEFLAREYLAIAAIRIGLARIRQAENEADTD
jgi:hypothetical protein